MRGDTSENLIALLERRLNSIIYRAKFVSTPFAARQFVSHGHVSVNGRASIYRAIAADRATSSGPGEIARFGLRIGGRAEHRA